MTVVWLDNLGSLGLAPDSPDRELPPEAFTRLENIRLTKGVAKSFLGEETVAEIEFPSQANFGIASRTRAAVSWLAAGPNNIWRTIDQELQDITPTAVTLALRGNLAWTGTTFNGVSILNPNNGSLPPLVATEFGRMRPLPNWPEGATARVVRAFGNFLIALNLTKNNQSQSLPHTVLWSHPADPGTIPVSWDISDPTKLAGEQPLGESQGQLVDCLPFGDMNVICKTDSTHAMHLTGGNQVFAFRVLFPDFGALAANCIVNTPRGQVIVGKDDIIIHTGTPGSKQSIVSERVLEWFLENLDPDYIWATHVTANRAFKEVWINFVSIDNTVSRCDKALIWNWERNTWTVRDLPDVGFVAEGVFAPQDSGVVFDTAANKIAFDSAANNVPFDIYSVDENQKRVVFLSDGIYRADYGGTTSGPAVAERTSLGIVGRDRQGNWKVDNEAIKFFTNLYPKITAPVGTEFSFYFGKQMEQNEDITWRGPFVFEAGVDKRVNFTMSTKLFSWRVECTEDVDWTLHGIGLDLNVTSRY